MTLTSLLRNGAMIVGFGAIFLGSFSGLPFPVLFATGGLSLAVLMVTGNDALAAQ